MLTNNQLLGATVRTDSKLLVQKGKLQRKQLILMMHRKYI